MVVSRSAGSPEVQSRTTDNDQNLWSRVGTTAAKSAHAAMTEFVYTVYRPVSFE